MAFLGPDDILVSEKILVKYGNSEQYSSPEPLVDLNVSNALERGLLGILVMMSNTTPLMRMAIGLLVIIKITVKLSTDIREI